MNAVTHKSENKEVYNMKALKTGLAAAVAAMALAGPARDIYVNDFSSRTSYEPIPESRWVTVRYRAGEGMIKDYVNTSDKINLTTTGGGTGDCQDGWVKVNKGKASENRGQFTVSADENPCGVFSMAMTNRFSVHHPIDNRFTSGVVRGSCDMYIPTRALVDNGHMRFRLETEEMMNDDEVVDNKLGYALFEAGINLRTNTGTLQCQVADLGGDGQGTVIARAGTAAAPGCWVRIVVEADLDSKTTYSYCLYDLGSDHPTFETSGTLKTEHTNRNFLRNFDASTMGGITGFAIRTTYGATLGYYGTAGYDDACAFKVDNLKVEWKAPGAAEFETVYLNDFAAAKTRTLSPAGTTSANLVAAKSDYADTVTYPASIVREYAGVDESKPTALVPAAVSANKTVYPQPFGYDGWCRTAADGAAQVVVTTDPNGKRMLGMLKKSPSFTFVGHPIGEKITTGKVKVEVDVRVPTKGYFQGTSGYCVAPQAMWNECLSNQGAFQYHRSGITWKSQSAPTEMYPLQWFGDGGDAPKNDTTKLVPLHWYRVTTTIDLDARPQLADYAITYIGEKPIGVDATPANEPLYTKTGLKLRAPAYDATKLPDVGSIVLFTYSTASAADETAYFTNIRVTKGVGTDQEKVVYKNDFTTRTRIDTVACQNLAAASKKDRMFEGVDTWRRNLGWTNYRVLGGANPVATVEADAEVGYSAVGIGRAYRRGDVKVRFDFFPPTYWMCDNNNWLRFMIGNDQYLSGSLANGDAYYQNNYHFCVSLGAAGSKNACGVYTSTSCSVGGAKWPSLGGTLTSNHWYRCEGVLHLDSRTGDFSLYDMGTTHPTLDTATPETAFGSTVRGLGFYSVNQGGTGEFSSIGLSGRGCCYPFARWLGDKCGAGMVDNIRIWRDDPGHVIILR